MKVYNTLTRRKEELNPITPGEVKIYACGPTVYNYIHIGNARPLCVFDVLRRYLEYRGYKVCFVKNFTDIDDIWGLTISSTLVTLTPLMVTAPLVMSSRAWRFDL